MPALSGSQMRAVIQLADVNICRYDRTKLDVLIRYTILVNS